MWFWGILAAVVAALIFVRMAPSDARRWHKADPFDADADWIGGARRVLKGQSEGDFARLDGIARATPRTTVLAGNVAEGCITYVTRTRWIGFPDYTTIQLQQGRILILGRLRFGRSDFGVNRARIKRWVAALQQGSQA